jgi:hypothetical protein
VAPKTRPADPKQFRRAALQLVRGRRSIPDVARSLALSPPSLRGWIRSSTPTPARRLEGTISESAGPAGGRVRSAALESSLAVLDKENGEWKSG